MPWSLPDELLPAHQAALEWHDALARFVIAGEAESIHFVEVQLRDPAEAEAVKRLEGEDFADWLEKNGYVDALDEHAFRHLAIALLSDFCHFIHEALRSSAMGKLTVAYNLLRKPLRDNLLYLEWMLADRAGFMARFRQGGNAADAAALGREAKLAIIRGALAASWPDGPSPEAVYEMRYDKDSSFGFESTWHKAHHLVTTARQYPTEPYNLNFIFSDDEARLSQWEGLYPPLVFLLVHAWNVSDALVRGFAPGFSHEAPLETARRVSSLLLYANGFDSDGIADAFKDMLAELLEEAGARCPACGASLGVDPGEDALERLCRTGTMRCPGCGASTEAGAVEAGEEAALDAEAVAVRAAFALWADDAGLSDGERSEAAFAAFAAGWEASGYRAAWQGQDEPG